ncbi:MAG: hypothetical protein JW940_13740 [Polyangiaceae bacterium]|nr:hypothetical protein [Polyangiaceae bacterium]
MAPAHRRDLLPRALELGAPRVDPYAPAKAYDEARWAGSALLVADPALDEIVLDRLQDGSLERDGVLLILAGALVQRDRAWRQYAAAVDAAGLGRDRALRFAQSCDRRATTLDPIETRLGIWARGRARAALIGTRVRTSGIWTMPAFGVLIAVAWGSVATAIATRTSDVPHGYAIGPGDTLAALSLLVAAVIFAAELAAERLQGLIARRVALSGPLAAALAFQVLLLLTASWRVSPGDVDNRAFLEALMVAGLVLSLTIALLGLLRRTDELRAIDLYARRRRRLFVRAGRIHGAVQSAAVKVRAEISSFGWARLSATRAHSERRAPIVAPRRGFVLVHLEALEAMDRGDRWRSQTLRLRVTTPLGEIVAAGEEVAAVVPDVGSNVSATDVAAAAQAVRTRKVGAAAEAIEAVGALVASVGRLASSGNAEAAARATDHLLDLLRVSLDAARRGRPEPPRGYYLPVSPLARVAVDRTLAAIRDEIDVRGSMETLLEGIVGLGAEHEGLPWLVVTRFTYAVRADGDTGLHINVLWHAARRAIDVADARAVTAVLGRLDELPDKERAVDLVGWIGTYAVWTRPDWAMRTLRWISSSSAPAVRRRVATHRLGAAAMLAGFQSLAADSAYGLQGQAAALRSYATLDTTAAYEQHVGELYGLPLGDDPQWALVEFADLVESLAP